MLSSSASTGCTARRKTSTPTAGTGCTATIFVAPQGIDNGWPNPNGTDVAFVDALLSALSSTLCLSTPHVYALGFSYGASMSRALACAPGVTTSASLGQHGVNDTVIPIASGREIRHMFVRSNGCDMPPQEPPAPEPLSFDWNKAVYDGCEPGYPVWWIAHGGGHVALPDGGAGGLSFAPAQIWDFFSQFK
ncbi:Feruloyl esterase C [Lasiodiplodia hormozganensis]|uniref:Feruloyl esterase C n=1 Tax=Lasiodiplodia hormozganensis TaxID=869390 RepID=A0AA39YIE8_9PEZI|nr:Feruloyl esterase C [Lasiodiplodia hormozganensis]